MTIADILKEIVHSPAQVYVLVGPAGLGKRRIAEEAAAQVLGVPIKELTTHPDYLIVEPSEEGKKAPSLADIREVLSRLSLRSMFGRRVAVIPAADRLSLGAQNALLKTLEEPKDGALLILLAENEEEVLPTIRSRAIVVRVPLPPRAQVVQEYGEALAQLARGLPSLAYDVRQNDDMRQVLLQARTDAQLFLHAPLWKRLALATAWTKESKKKGGSIPLVERLLALEDIARLATQVGDAQAARLMAALPRAFVDIQQNTNTTVIVESLALALGDS